MAIREKYIPMTNKQYENVVKQIFEIHRAVLLLDKVLSESWEGHFKQDVSSIRRSIVELGESVIKYQIAVSCDDYDE